MGLIFWLFIFFLFSSHIMSSMDHCRLNGHIIEQGMVSLYRPYPFPFSERSLWRLGSCPMRQEGFRDLGRTSCGGEPNEGWCILWLEPFHCTHPGFTRGLDMMPKKQWLSREHNGCTCLALIQGCLSFIRGHWWWKHGVGIQGWVSQDDPYGGICGLWAHKFLAHKLLIRMALTRGSGSPWVMGDGRVGWCAP